MQPEQLNRATLGVFSSTINGRFNIDTYTNINISISKYVDPFIKNISKQVTSFFDYEK